MSHESNFTDVRSQFGTFRLFSNGRAITKILLPSQLTDDEPECDGTDEILPAATAEFDAYFGGQSNEFQVPYEPEFGTEFQRDVWLELRRIPVGTTISYSELASRVGRPAAVRAVGTANGRNPLPIVVPCHRVIGADGTLTGYAGGLQLKQQLLEHEKALQGAFAAT